MATDKAIGMMDNAYFVGRKEILDWINETLNLNTAKIEETCSGAIACQLIDAHFPGKVPMQKVQWDARNDYEYVNNYKVLQSCFSRLKIDKSPDVDKLIRGKYQDNLEFMQWCKAFCERHQVAEGYDPVERRSRGKGGDRVPTRGAGGAAAQGSSRSAASKPSRSRSARPAASKGDNNSNKAPAPRDAAMPPPPATEKENRQVARGAANAKADAALTKKVEKLESEKGELAVTVESLEKERDFYYDKLREIEIKLQTLQEDLGEAADEQSLGKKAMMDEIFSILYATTDEFVAVDEEGEPVETASELTAPSPSQRTAVEA